MAGVPAGRLSIEIVAEVARLQQDLDKAKRAVKSMSDDIARNTRAANDNFTNMGRGFERTGQRVTASAGQQRMGMQQLSMNLNDVATMYAMGARPMQIFASQSGQVLQAVQLMNGGSSKFATFMMGPWGMALTVATIALTPLIGKLFEAEEATKKVEFAGYALGDAQSILGSVMDLTTGKINTQSEALLALARAQAIAGRIQAETRAAQARSQVQSMQDKEWTFSGGLGGGFNIGRKSRIEGQVSSQLLNEVITGEQAVKKLEHLRDIGRITNETFLDAAAAVANLGVETENIKVFEQLEKALDGDRGAVQGFLDPKKTRQRAAGMSDEAKALRDRNNETQRFIESLEEEIAKVGLDEKALRALEVARAMEAAVTEMQRARIAELNTEREKALALAERELRIKDAQKETEKLTTSVEAVRREAQVFEMMGWAREKALLRLEREAEIKPLLARQTVALAQGESALADEIQRQIRLLNERYGLEIQMGDRLDQLEQWEKRFGRMRDFLADVNKTPTQMAMEFEDVKMRGLDRFNDELVDAIINFRSLGDMASSVLKQILGDLLHLQLRKSIIGPLANMLGLALPGGGGGGPIDLLANTPFGGARAGGGPVIPGHAYMVGEQGRELFVPDAPGSIVPNRMLGANDNGVVRIEVANESELFRIKVNGQIMESAGGIAKAGALGGASLASKRSARAARRRIGG